MNIESMPAKIKSFWRRLLRRQQIDLDLDDELRSQLALMIDEKISKGMPSDEARRAAIVELGGIEQLKEQVRTARTGAWLDSLAQDLRFGLRMLRKSPGFTTVAVLTLALGISANTAIFSIVDGILWRRLPYAHVSQLATITVFKLIGQGELTVALSPGHSKALLFDTPGIQQLATYNSGQFTRTDGESPELVEGAHVSGNFFSTMGAKPLLGRSITPTDTQPGEDGVVVLSYAFWRDHLGSDARVLGRIVTLDDRRYTVIGVMPRYFDFPSYSNTASLDFWAPLVILPNDENVGGENMIARLKNGVSLDALNAQLKTVAPRFWPELPPTMNGAQVQANSIEPILGNLKIPLRILTGAVSFVLLIACVNISALLLGRGWSRQREIAMRKALGASRARIVRQLLVEGLLISILGGCLAVLLTGMAVRILHAMAPPNQPRIAQAQLDTHVLVYTLAVSVVACLLFALLPALQASASSIGHAIKGDTASGSAVFSYHPNRLRNALVIFEIACAVVLVTGAALMSRSLDHAVHADLGFRTDHILTASASLSPSICNARVKDDAKKCAAATREIVNRIAGAPGVEAAAAASTEPVNASLALRIQIQGQTGGFGFATGQIITYRGISSDYFRAVWVPLLAGRTFDASDTTESQPVAIVNRAFATQFLGSSNGLDARFSIQTGPKDSPIKWIDVVGIVADSEDEGHSVTLHRPDPEYYIPLTQLAVPVQPHLTVRTAMDPLAILPVIRRALASVDKEAPLTNILTMNQVVANSTAESRFETVLLSSFGILGLALAIVGAYGVISYRVTQRTHEIGIRMALGAQPASVLRLVLREGLTLAIAGVLVGLCGAFALTRFLRSLLFEIKPTDPGTFAGVAVLLMFVVLLASYIPARRAMKVDPMVALRHE